MRKAIFVDDEPRILQGLRRQLRPLRDEWEMTFATGGREALAIMQDEGFDAIISDMRMPGMDGAEFLAHCRARHPEATRIVLSGHMERDSTLQAVRVAHQFLTKPCDAQSLRDVLRRIAALHAFAPPPHLRACLGGIDSVALPTAIHQELVRTVEDPDCDPASVEAIVATNPVLVAKLLQLVNSAFVGSRQSVTRLDDAIRTIGPRMLRELVVSIGIVHGVDDDRSLVRFDSNRHRQHATAVAELAWRLAGPGHRDTAFSAGLLHDVGEVLLAVHLPAESEAVRARVATEGRARAEIERELLGFSHAETGAYLLGLWGLPAEIVRAVAHHHDPSRVAREEIDAVLAVHVADALDVEALGSTGTLALDNDEVERWIAPDVLSRCRAEGVAPSGEEVARVR